MDILYFKCPACGKVGTIRQYERKGNGYDGYTYNLIPLEKTCLRNYARLVCTDCCFTFGYWPDVKELFAEEQKAINLKKTYSDYISSCEEIVIKLYREWVSRFVNTISPKIAEVCSLDKEKEELEKLLEEYNDENITMKRHNELESIIAEKKNCVEAIEEKAGTYNELKEKWSRALNCSNDGVFKIKTAPLIINEKTGLLEKKPIGHFDSFYRGSKETFGEEYKNIYLKMEQLNIRLGQHNAQNYIFEAQDLETVCKYQSILFLLKRKEELTDSRNKENLYNYFEIDLSKELAELSDYINAQPLPDLSFR